MSYVRSGKITMTIISKPGIESNLSHTVDTEVAVSMRQSADLCE